MVFPGEYWSNIIECDETCPEFKPTLTVSPFSFQMRNRRARAFSIALLVLAAVSASGSVYQNENVNLRKFPDARRFFSPAVEKVFDDRLRQQCSLFAQTAETIF